MFRLGQGFLREVKYSNLWRSRILEDWTCVVVRSKPLYTCSLNFAHLMYWIRGKATLLGSLLHSRQPNHGYFVGDFFMPPKKKQSHKILKNKFCMQKPFLRQTCVQVTSLKESIGCYRILGAATGERHGLLCFVDAGERGEANFSAVSSFNSWSDISCKVRVILLGFSWTGSLSRPVFFCLGDFSKTSYHGIHH